MEKYLPEIETPGDIEEQDKVVQDLIEEVAGYEDADTAQYELEILEEKREGRRTC